MISGFLGAWGFHSYPPCTLPHPMPLPLDISRKTGCLPRGRLTLGAAQVLGKTQGLGEASGVVAGATLTPFLALAMHFCTTA